MTLRATLSLRDSSGPSWDVVVIGAGPAGSIAALELARQGAKVLLVDRSRFPRWKVCGCCLNSRAEGALDAVGLVGLLKRCKAQALGRLTLAAQGKQAHLSVRGHALSREVFDASLIEAAVHAGAHFLPDTQARLDSPTYSSRQIHLRQGQEEAIASASVVVGANGLGGKLLPDANAMRRQIADDSRLGAGAISTEAPDAYRAGMIFMACGRGGYVGLVRLEDDRLDIAAAFDAGFVKQAGGLGRAAAAILQEGGLPAIPGIETLPWHGTPLLTGHTPIPGAERLFLVGDAAGYVEPFTGEGMAWALASGLAVVPLALQACQRWEPTLLEQWSLLYQQTVTRRQWPCKLAAQALRHPTLMRMAVMALSYFPFLASPVVNYLNQEPVKKNEAEETPTAVAKLSSL